MPPRGLRGNDLVLGYRRLRDHLVGRVLHDEAGVEVGPGHAPSAPVRPRLGLKAGVTTAIAVVLWGVTYWIIESDLISFREI